MSTEPMSSKTICKSCLALSLAWIGVVGALAWINLPRMPLDLSPIDPATIAAFRLAIIKHTALYAGVALLPPLLSALVARLVGGKKAQ